MMDLSRISWTDVETSLWRSGYANLPRILTPEECNSLIGLYVRRELFRSRIEMAQFRFGIGDYQYFDYPLPEIVRKLREQSYAPLAGMANRWMEALGEKERFPEMLPTFLKQCQDAGQAKATPLLLHYEAGGYNCLHQDLYGEIAFPLQLVSMLNSPGQDFEGGDFLLVEQRPRAQSVGHAIHIAQGEAVVFTTRYRPVRGARGFYRVNVKHGVSPLLSGTRHTLGIIYHDAH